jgi:RIO-like serine/threonine protein kinase
LHQLGVAHGDVRLPNVVRDDQRKLYLIDFTEAVFKCDGEEEFTSECKRDLECLNNLFNGGQ